MRLEAARRHLGHAIIPPLRGTSAPSVCVRPLAAAVLIAASFLPGCGRDRDKEGGWLPGDSLSDRPEGPPSTSPESAAAGAGGAPLTAEICPPDSLNAERLDLTARLRDGHVRVEGTVREGTGKALNLGLSQRGSFVSDEVFRGERFGVLMLGSDSVDVSSVSYEPSPQERAAFARTGAVTRDPDLPLCLEISLYEKGSLDLLAARYIEVSGTSRD